jgi:hypothetical protein
VRNTPYQGPIMRTVFVALQVTPSHYSVGGSLLNAALPRPSTLVAYACHCCRVTPSLSTIASLCDECSCLHSHPPFLDMMPITPGVRAERAIRKPHKSVRAQKCESRTCDTKASQKNETVICWGEVSTSWGEVNKSGAPYALPPILCFRWLFL